MKILKSFLVFILIICGVLIFLEVIPVAPRYAEANPWIIKDGERPLIIPHASSLKLYPPDTLYSFQKLKEDGYDVFEIDLCLTKNGMLVSHHDVDIKGDIGVDKRIRELDYDELAAYNYAKDFELKDHTKPFADIPDDQALTEGLVPAKLEDLFKTYPDQKYILELKDTVENSGEDVFKLAVSALLELIDTYNMNDNVIVSSFDDNVTHLIQEESDGTVMTSTATKDSFNFVIFSTLRLDFFYRPKDGALLLPIKDDLTNSQRDLVEKVPAFLRNQLTTYDKDTDTYYTNLDKASIIRDAHRHNMAVQYWTVNDKSDMKRLIDMGVDGIITDYPELLLEVYEELGL